MQESVAVFLMVSFSFALVLIMKRDSLPDKLRRPLAMLALVMVALAFAFLVRSFFPQ